MEKTKISALVIVFALISVLLLVFIFAANDNLSFESEQSQLTSAQQKSDPDASNGSYIEFAGEVDPPGDGTRGPTGRWPSHTPAYTTPADVVVTSWNQLQSEINNGFSGKVIEANISTPGVGIDIDGGSTSWSQNILVRPPIGERNDKFILSSGNNYMDASHVTFAGLTLTGGNLRTTEGERSVFAWTEVVSPRTGFFFDDQPSVEIWELAESHNKMRTVESTAPSGVCDSKQRTGSPTDTMQMRATGGSERAGGFFTGIYLTGAPMDQNFKDRDTLGDGLCSFDKPHMDTIQFFTVGGGRIEDVTIENSVIISADDKSIQLAHIYGSLVIDNVYISEPQFVDDNWPRAEYDWEDPKFVHNGFHAITPNNNGTSFDVATKIFIRNSDIAGSIGLETSESLGELTNTRVHGNPRALSSSGNTLDSSYSGPPPPRPTTSYLNSVWSD